MFQPFNFASCQFKLTAEFSFIIIKVANKFTLVIITTIVCVLLLAALSLPIYFWTGAPWIRVVNIVIFLLIFFAPAQIAEFAVNNHQSPTIAAITQLINYQSWQLALGGMAVMLVLMTVSYYISFCIYMKKDF